MAEKPILQCLLGTDAPLMVVEQINSVWNGGRRHLGNHLNKLYKKTGTKMRTHLCTCFFL
ncbi:hypothetical protein DOT_3249 [Desulfosporosinus sp. OT]|nr:hypothetical protein DOT_3249 [Desulfosporosinus sp. OT]